MNYEALRKVEQWSAAQGSGVNIGDARRTARAVKVGANIAKLPSGSLPHHQASWGELKAAYRLLSEAAVLQP
jgi:Transposase DNA-binding